MDIEQVLTWKVTLIADSDEDVMISEMTVKSNGLLFAAEKSLELVSPCLQKCKDNVLRDNFLKVLKIMGTVLCMNKF